VEAEIGKGTARAPQLASGPLGNIEKVTFGQQELLSVYLQETLAFEDNARDINLGVYVEGYALPPVEAQVVAVEVRAFEREGRTLKAGLVAYVKEVDNLGLHSDPPEIHSRAYPSTGAVTDLLRVLVRPGHLLYSKSHITASDQACGQRFSG
jgi:hypothetical protein